MSVYMKKPGDLHPAILTLEVIFKELQDNFNTLPPKNNVASTV